MISSNVCISSVSSVIKTARNLLFPFIAVGIRMSSSLINCIEFDVLIRTLE